MELAAGCLIFHCQGHHSVERGYQGNPPPPPPPSEAQNYQISFLVVLTRLRCPVEGCQGGVTRQTNLRVHFEHCHVRDTIVILE